MEANMCRICLGRAASILVFDVEDGISYCDKIMKCVATIRIEKDDGFPEHICEECVRELAASYDFARKCEASDIALRNCSFNSDNPEIFQEPSTPSDTKEYEDNVKEEPYSPSYSPPDPYNLDLYNNEYLEDVKNELEENLDNHHEKKQKVFKKESKSNKHKSKMKYKKVSLPGHLRKIKMRVITGPIQCTECGLVSSCHSAHQIHLRKHTNEKPFTCDVCNKSYRTKHSLQSHILRHNCFSNIKIERNVKEFDKRKNKHKMPPVACLVCGLQVYGRSVLDAHMRTHTGEKPFPCQVCGKTFALKGSLARHMATHSTNRLSDCKFVCEHCGKRFAGRNNIIVHLRVHTGDKPYKCPYCPMQFTQISPMVRHKRRHTGEKPFICATCGKSFIDASLLKKHHSVHSNEKNYPCHICNKTLKTKGSLKIHIDSHNNTKRSICNTKRSICNICGQEFTMKGNLVTHLKRAHSEKSGFCTSCNKTYPDIDIHMRVHRGEKPFVCKICDQGYTTKNGLAHHMNFKHRDSAKFKCTTDACNRSFPTMSMLEFHVLKQHLDTSPYVCRHCARSFLRPSDLSRHLKIFHLDTHTQVKSQFIKTIKLSD